MKPGSILVNNARGSLVDLEAAAEAARRGHLRGMAADVFPREPESNGPGFECPLVGVPGALLTPHIGGSTEEAQESIGRDVAEKLLRFVLGGSSRGAVNVPEVDLPRRVEGRHRILHFHRNVPGVLGRMHTMLAARESTSTRSTCSLTSSGPTSSSTSTPRTPRPCRPISPRSPRRCGFD